MIWIVLLAAAGGYVASIYTWPMLRGWFTGAEAELAKLREQVMALQDKIKAKF